MSCAYAQHIFLTFILSVPLWNPFHIDQWNVWTNDRSIVFVRHICLIINSMWNWQHRQFFSNATVFCCCYFFCFHRACLVFDMTLIKYAWNIIYSVAVYFFLSSHNKQFTNWFFNWQLSAIKTTKKTPANALIHQF